MKDQPRIVRVWVGHRGVFEWAVTNMPYVSPWTRNVPQTVHRDWTLARLYCYSKNIEDDSVRSRNA